jgi:glycosyltransferase involved in cell wall biosynthesis
MGILVLGEELLAPSHEWMRHMLEALAEDVAVLCSPDPSCHKYRDRFRTVALDSDRTLWTRINRRFGRAPLQRKLAEAAADPEVDLVLVHYVTTANRFTSVWRELGRPVFVCCHGYDVTWDLREQTGAFRPVHRADYREQVRRLGRTVQFIANSHHTAQRLLEIDVPAERIHVNYLGVDVPPQPRREVKRSGPLNILYLGRLIDCKAPDLVIQAFDRACARGLDATLDIAGDGPLRLTCELLRARSRFKERIRMHGAVDAATGRRLREMADMFTAHSCRGPISGQEEAFGVAFVEAMAAGLPVVTGKNGSLPELIQNGVEGILFEPGDIEAHAQAMLDLAYDPQRRHAMGQAAWQRAHDHFTTETSTRNLKRILKLYSRTPDALHPCSPI